MDCQRAVIIGAGPAGLTAAYELLSRTGIVPLVLEKSQYMGGIARTLNYKGNRIDLGGHRFFSKSDRVMDWWLSKFPLEKRDGADGPDPEREDRVMLLRQRKSRIYFLRRFFDYPIRLSTDTLVKLGPARTTRIGFSYLKSAALPIRKVANLEQFLINRFGRELYLTFFKSYTEKVWGVPCPQISAEWGEQRIKGLSVAKTLAHFLKRAVRMNGDVSQKGVETSLIEQFIYPKYGPGQIWEEVAREVADRGGEVLTGWDAKEVHVRNGRVHAVTAEQATTGERKTFAGDFFFSTMPVQELVRAVDVQVPAEIRTISDGLQYRDFITVGLLVKKLKVRDAADPSLPVRDNWIYIQEPDVLAGRLQIFNNWSPYLVADPLQTWIGVEYFCYETDEIWHRPDREMAQLACDEMHRIGILDRADVTDWTVFRMPKTYPAYFGTYARFDRVREYLDGFENLFLIGRNGMHKYNNQDHSMLTAMIAVDNIVSGQRYKSNLWSVNTEMEYHETRQGSETDPAGSRAIR